jgi:cobalt-zinc-cadmium efflux system outer membrane protein
MGVSARAEQIRVAHALPPLPNEDGRLESMTASAADQRIDVLAAALEVEAAERASTAAAWGRVPEIRGGAGLEREIDGHLVIGPAFQIGLPLFDRNQGEIAKAEARIKVAREQQRALLDAVSAEVGAASARLSAARKTVEYYRDEVLPLRAHIVALAQRQYNQMQLGVFELLRAKKSETEARRQAIEALRDYWRARVDLEQAVGR